MLGCTETITLVRTDGETYQTEVIECASWYDKSEAQKMERGLQMFRTTLIRIPEAYVPAMFPTVGDIVVKGSVTDISSIKDLQNYTYCRVMTVSDNRRKGIGLKHIALKCE